jgi:hypothetical protein
MIGEMFGNASIVAKLGMAVAVLPIGAAVLYAIKPTERTLTLVCPLSLAAVFAGLTSLTVGVASVLQGIEAGHRYATQSGGNIDWGIVALGASESVLGLFFACGCLTISWLFVALGLRRTT